MRAIQFNRYGPADVLETVDLPEPHPGRGQVRIRVGHVGVNPADAKWRAGVFAAHRPLTLPMVPGYDVAGTIDMLGADVDGLGEGDRVCVMLDSLRMGAYAETVITDADRIARIPDQLSLTDAALLPTPALTGFQLIEDHVDPQPGQTVLVTGAVGAVGRCALQAARFRGVRTVAAVKSHQVAAAEALGADQVITLGQPVEGIVKYDHVADTIGGITVAQLCQRLPPAARVRTVATTPIPDGDLLTRPEFCAVYPDGKRLEDICRMATVRPLAAPIVCRFPLDAAREAHRLLDKGRLGGRILIDVTR